MNKKLIPATFVVLTCTATLPAVAQSNVTIYGLIDINMAREWAGDMHRTGVDTSELNGSRLGFRGSEDLGNGLKAIYTLEAGFSPDADSVIRINRQSFVGLENRWGRVTAGRQYSPAFVALDPFEATGGADRTTGLLHRKSGAVTRGYQVRFDNMIKYRSPTMSGFTFDLGYWNGAETPSNDSNVRRQGRGHGLTAMYKNGPLAAAVTTQSFISNDTGGRATTQGIGGSYDLGVATLYALYSQDKERGSLGTGKARSYSIGATIPLSAADTLALSYGMRDERGEAGAEDAKGASVYYMHDLSKRTTLYAGYSQLNNDTNANYGFNFTPAAGDTVRVVMAGMRHKF